MKPIAATLLGRCLLGLTAMMFMVAASASEVVQGPAPDFALKTDSGSNLRLSELRGDVVMINFWASWCGPCREEMPLLDEIHQRYKPLGFTVLGVNVEEDSRAAKALLEQIPVSFPILFDNDSTVSKLYDVRAMPSTILVDRDGNMRYLHRGYKPGYEQQYTQQVRALVRE
jgi:thiol-disulfide isomerase/thioredoxin